MSAQIETVGRKNISFDNQSIEVLARELNNGSRLILDSCQIDSSVNIQPLTKALKNNTSLITFSITNSTITRKNLELLFEALTVCEAPIRNFSFTYNKLTFEDLKLLPAALKKHRLTLTKLDLSGCPFATKPKLGLILDENQTPTTDLAPNIEFMTQLSTVIYNLEKLNILTLKNCGLYHHALTFVLRKGLMHKTSLKSIGLSNNFMDDAGFINILNGITDSRVVNGKLLLPQTVIHLEELNLSGNLISGIVFSPKQYITSSIGYYPLEIIRSYFDEKIYYILKSIRRNDQTEPVLAIDLSYNILSDELLKLLERIQNYSSVRIKVENSITGASKFVECLEQEKIEVMAMLQNPYRYIQKYDDKIKGLSKAFERTLMSLHQKPAVTMKKEEKEKKERKDAIEGREVKDKKESNVFEQDAPSLKNAVLTNSVVTALSTGPILSNKVLYLKECTIPENVDLTPLIKAISERGIDKVIITQCSIDAKQFELLCQGLAKNKSLVYLDLSKNDMGRFKIVDFSLFPNLKTLILKECNLDLPILVSLAKRLPESLSELDLSRNNLTKDRVIAFLESLNDDVKYKLCDVGLDINFSSNLLYRDCGDIARKVVYSRGLDKRLKGMNLSNNAFTKEDIEIFESIMKTHCAGFFNLTDNNLKLAEDFKMKFDQLCEEAYSVKEKEIKEGADVLAEIEGKFDKLKQEILTSLNKQVETLEKTLGIQISSTEVKEQTDVKEGNEVKERKEGKELKETKSSKDTKEMFESGSLDSDTRQPGPKALLEAFEMSRLQAAVNDEAITENSIDVILKEEAERLNATETEPLNPAKAVPAAKTNTPKKQSFVTRIGTKLSSLF